MRVSTRKTRGQILILTAFFVFLMLTLAISFFKIIPAELNSALRSRQSVAAQVCTESGFKDAIAWLESQPAVDVLPQSRLDADYNASYQDAPRLLTGDWAYSVRITARPESPFLYDVVSQALFDGEIARESLATVSRSNFARYALFIDRWRRDMIYAMTPGAITGPFHTNDFFQLALSDSFYNPANQPFVSGPNASMTHARLTTEGTLDFRGDGNAYYGAGGTFNSDPNLVPYDANGAVDSRYRSIVEGGRANLQVVDPIPLPYSAEPLYQDATRVGDGDPPFVPPTDTMGFAIPGNDTRVSGGIYIKGDVDIALSLTPEGNQLHQLTQVIPDEAYRIEREVNHPIPVYEEVFIAPEPGAVITVPEYEQRLVEVTRQQIVGYEEVTRTRVVQEQRGTRLELVGGITTSVPVYVDVTVTYVERVPIYDDVTVEEMQTVATGNMITLPDTGQTILRPTGEFEDNIVTESELITPEEYEANPDLYPGAQFVLLPGSEKSAQIVEVTAETGFSGLGVTAAKGSTVVQDYEGNVTVRQGNLNGVTFVDGDIGSLGGVSKGALTTSPTGQEAFTGRYIVANPQSGRSLTITDDMLNFYDGSDPELRDGQTPMALRRDKLNPTGEHALGLVAEKVRLAPQPNNPVLHLYAVFLAGRSLPGTDPDRPDVSGGFGTIETLLSGGGLKEFRLFGGLVEANADLWNAGGSGLTGKLTYDPAVSEGLPRFPRSQELLTLRYTDHYVESE